MNAIHTGWKYYRAMLTEQEIRKRFKRFRSFEKVCLRFHDFWSGDSSFSGHFSKFSSVVLKLELIVYTQGTTLNPAMEDGKRRVVINPLQLNETMHLLIREIEEHIVHMEHWCRKNADTAFCKALNKVTR